MAIKKSVIEQQIGERQKKFEKDFGNNFHSMYEFEGVTKALLATAKKNVKVMGKMQNLLSIYTSSQVPDEQIKIEATRTEMRDSAVWAIDALLDLVGALDNFNFSQLIYDKNE